MKKANMVVKRGTSSWKQQIVDSIHLEESSQNGKHIFK